MNKSSIYQSPLTYLGIIFWVFVASCGQDKAPVVNLTVEKDTTIVEEPNIQAQIDLLNTSGEFLDFNLMVVEDGNPIEAATVEMIASLNGEQKTVSATTDAEGMVYIDNLTIGGNILKISKEGYSTMLGVINFRFEKGYNYEIVDGSVLPIAKNESAIVPLFSGDSESSATITGRVTIETDLTNNTYEFPEGVQIAANLTEYIISQSEGVNISEFTMNTNGNYGTTTIAADGTYELKVPAKADGATISLLIPEITKDQTLYAYGTEAEPSDVPQLLTIATSYGPEIYNYSQTPSISGVKVDFNEPNGLGSGLKISNIRKAGRPFTSSYFYPGINVIESGIKYSFDAGQGYESIPTVEITDENGTGAEAFANLDYAIAGITLDSTFTGYFSGQYAYLEFIYEYTDQYNGNTYQNSFRGLSIYADDNGEITQQAITSIIDQRIEYGYSGYGNYYDNSYNTQITDFYAQIYVPSVDDYVRIDGLNMNTRINGIQFYSYGEGYINPTLAIVGGNPTTPASFTIHNYANYYTFDLDNSQITNPYTALTFDVEIEYYSANSGSENAQVTTLVYDNYTGQNDQIKDFLTVTTDGQIALANENYSLRTRYLSYREPSFYITDHEAVKPSAGANVNADGEITNLYVYTHGYGYSDKPEITISPVIEGIGGSGASVQARGGSYYSNLYSWNGAYDIVSSGSGYVGQLNQSASVFGSYLPFSTSASNVIKAVTGQSYVRNIDYGTGARTVKIND